jgi:hypothetical protein
LYPNGLKSDVFAHIPTKSYRQRLRLQVTLYWNLSQGESMKNAVLTLILMASVGCAIAQNSSQATEAAKKHRAEKMTGAPTNASTSTKASTSGTSPDKPATTQAQGSVAQQLAACKSNAKWNLYKRERCVWSLCNGRWDKDGCPPQGTNTVQTQ